MVLAFGGPAANSWAQVGDLLAALVLCGLIGLERELQHKSAGLRTNAIIGVASALFMQVSKFGFSDVLSANHVSFDPSRVAAQVVTGIGFVGAGLIFVHRGDVRGLTTATTAWLAAAVGMACGAGLVPLAAILTGISLAVLFGLVRFERDPRHHQLRVCASDDRAHVDQLVDACRKTGFEVKGIASEPTNNGLRAITISVTGVHEIAELFHALRGVDGVSSVQIDARELTSGQ